MDERGSKAPNHSCFTCFLVSQAVHFQTMLREVLLIDPCHQLIISLNIEVVWWMIKKRTLSLDFFVQLLYGTMIQ